jgi:hypothetical protein
LTGKAFKTVTVVPFSSRPNRQTTVSMGRLLQLLLRNGGFVTLVFVELFCFMLIVNYNTSQAVIWANTTDIFGGRLMERRQRVSDYFSLQERADSLAVMVDSLQERLASARYVQVPVRDTFYRVTFDSITGTDSLQTEVCSSAV